MFNIIELAVKDNGVMGNLQEYGGNVTLSGILIVFILLILLVIVISVFGAFMSRTSGASVKEKQVQPKPQKKVEKKVEKKSAPVVNSSVQTADDNDDDVIAAISAAVMMMYEGTGKTPVIRSIRPATVGTRSAWRTAGIANNIRSF